MTGKKSKLCYLLIHKWHRKTDAARTILPGDAVKRVFEEKGKDGANGGISGGYSIRPRG
jgi:hypothetical protein